MHVPFPNIILYTTLLCFENNPSLYNRNKFIKDNNENLVRAFQHRNRPFSASYLY